MKPLAALSDAVIAMLAALALFLTPLDRAKGIRAMDWETAVKLPWGVLMLFGEGLTLAASIERTACRSSSATRAAARRPASAPPAARDHGDDGVLSELTSNTAQVATMVPVLAAMAPCSG